MLLEYVAGSYYWATDYLRAEEGQRESQGWPKMMQSGGLGSSPNSNVNSLVSRVESPAHPVPRSTLETLQALCLEAEHVSSILRMRKLKLRENKVMQLVW